MRNNNICFLGCSEDFLKLIHLKNNGVLVLPGHATMFRAKMFRFHVWHIVSAALITTSL
jgi:hypothetical protein